MIDSRPFEIRTTPCPLDPVFHEAGGVLFTGLSDLVYQVPGTWSIRKNSLLLWLDPRPAPESIPLLYRNYYTHQTPRPQSGILGRLIERAYLTTMGLLPYMKERAHSERMYLGEGKGQTLLEIGCGNGSRLNLLREMGWNVIGQEVDETAANSARQEFGVEVRVGDVSTIGVPEESLDAVISNHVIEHVLDPVALVAQCHRLLRPGGTLVLATPNGASFGQHVFGPDWYALDPPRHLQIFSLEALLEVVRRAGFVSIEGWSSCAMAQTIGRGSVDFRTARRRRHDAHRSHIRDTSISLANLEALIFQWRACWHERRYPGSGEELFVRATKERSGRS